MYEIVRLVMKISIQHLVTCFILCACSAFEKSLRNRLLKTNPDTDYHCLTTFGSFFTKDIPLPAGTTVDFRRTADGQLITESKSLLVGNLTLYMHCCWGYLAASPYVAKSDWKALQY
ncbi:hypothetical protein NC653_039406 [Populus alba x Populus x berolinensis]|uniref:Uncharacterized protein n=1 Tax=Populus alba x Populus x berolinensis TaxID=444605 RepID=A0AAD6PQJ8_9ROSI|nr:hypothetical protein NC653_039406 [Populus alba x Populus x berolinensis]